MPERINLDNPDFDVLGDVLKTLRFHGTIFFRSDLAAPWGISLKQIGIPRFHIILSGECYVGAQGVAPVKARRMDIIMIPNGHSHWIADQPNRELVSSERAGEACELGQPLFQDNEITNELMCGIVHFDREAAHPILDSLPHILHFSSLEADEPIWMTVSLILCEMGRIQDHCGPIVDRLTEVLFLQLLNRYVTKNDEPSGFLAALSNRRIHHALTLIHQEPNFDWSLSSLGERIGMSRATLNRHFQDTIGVAPMTYISNWRIMKAYNLIKYTATPIKQIAEMAGFASARTLGKAFQRHYGCTPSELRRLQRA